MRFMKSDQTMPSFLYLSPIFSKGVREFVECPRAPRVHEMQHTKSHEIIFHRLRHKAIQIPDSVDASVENIVRLEFL
jgi:hypothetical protein